jgi:hypothetical protein
MLVHSIVEVAPLSSPPACSSPPISSPPPWTPSLHGAQPPGHRCAVLCGPADPSHSPLRTPPPRSPSQRAAVGGIWSGRRGSKRNLAINGEGLGGAGVRRQFLYTDQIESPRRRSDFGVAKRDSFPLGPDPICRPKWPNYTSGVLYTIEPQAHS